MKIYIRLLCILAFSAFISIKISAQVIPADSLYLGQTPPVNTPKIFKLPASPGHHPIERIAITSDGKEIYFGELDTYPASDQRIFSLKYIANKWQGPFIEFEGYMGAKLSDNDSTIFMQKEIGGIPTVFFSKRINTGWSVPARLMTNNKQQHYFQKTKLNNCYLSSNFSGGIMQRDICRLVITNSDTVIQSLGIPINTADDENDFYVADDESYMFLSRSNNTTAGDIFISYKNNKGEWTNPKSVGSPINTPSPNWEYGHFVSPDKKYLFFTRGGNSMSSYFTYWVRIDKLIDSLKNTNYAPYLKNQIANQTAEPGKNFNFAFADSVFNDDDGINTLTYTAALSNGNPLPSWLSFNQAKREFTGTPSESASLPIKITAKDSANISVACTFTITVKAANGVEKTNGQLPGNFNLYQNYPNPFNPTTNIEFAIAKSGRYSLKVFNAIGELQKVVSEREYGAGYFKETLDASGLSSGLYIYNLIGQNVNLTKKMILLR